MRYMLLMVILVSSLLVSGIVLADSRVDEHTVLLLTFDEEPGDIAKDSSGKGNHGEISGSKWVEGVSGTGLEFEKATDGVVMPASDTLDITEQLTLEIWMKPLSLAARGDPISKHQQAGYALILDGGFAKPCHHIEGAYAWGDSKTPLEEGKWYYIATTYDGKSIKTYINGELDGEVATKGKITSSEGGLALGGIPRDVSQFPFFGVVDEFRVSDIARTEEEIRQAMDVELAKSVEPSGKLVITWANVKTQF